jgi:hypothetical protein
MSNYFARILRMANPTPYPGVARPAPDPDSARNFVRDAAAFGAQAAPTGEPESIDGAGLGQLPVTDAEPASVRRWSALGSADRSSAPRLGDAMHGAMPMLPPAAVDRGRSDEAMRPPPADHGRRRIEQVEAQVTEGPSTTAARLTVERPAQAAHSSVQDAAVEQAHDRSRTSAVEIMRQVQHWIDTPSPIRADGQLERMKMQGDDDDHRAISSSMNASMHEGRSSSAAQLPTPPAAPIEVQIGAIHVVVEDGPGNTSEAGRRATNAISYPAERGRFGRSWLHSRFLRG